MNNGVHETPQDPRPSDVLDALIIGAGVAGIETLHRLRERGFDAHVVDAASGVGGTWHWNRYPGARLDSESYSYGYFFSRELREGWNWSEHFCAQPENEAYFNYVVDTWDLRPHITLNTRVTSAHFDAGTDTWRVTADDGREFTSRFLLTGIGILSDPRYPQEPGRERFRGESYHTARWPKEGVDLTGKRVAVIGTGASGVQTIASIGPIVGSLTVFQRTPNWCPPLNNEPLSALEMAEIKGSYDTIWARTQNSRGGFVHGHFLGSVHDYTAEERHEWYETLYARRGFARLYTNFPEVIRTEEFNKEFSAFLEAKIRARIDDQSIADKLIPTDHGFGQKRPPYETNYYEVYNQPNVELVSTHETPIVEFTEDGIVTTEQLHEFDVIIYATGFHAVTGAFDRIDIRGVDGVSLVDAWREGPKTWAGLATPGFPNLLYLGGPQAMGGNIPRAIEKQVPFVADLLDHLRTHGWSRIDAQEDVCKEWADEIAYFVSMTLYRPGVTSWFWTEAGEGHSFGIYPAGIIEYGKRLSAIEDADYRGFTLTKQPERAGQILSGSAHGGGGE